MSGTGLRKLLDLFQASQGALSISYLANELEITNQRAESMVDFWIRKGKIRVSSSLSDCGSCGVKGDCPLVFDLPRIYELVGPEQSKEELVIQIPCSIR